MSTLPTLSLLETRVLGVLVEKQHTVPDSYPLTLNALVGGCNQKTSRDPVIEASEAEVQAAIDHLKSLSLVMESSGGRVMRYAQNVGKVLGVPPQSVALLTILFLRGPADRGRAAHQQRAAAQVRRRARGRGLPARARGEALREGRGQAAGRARDALGAPAFGRAGNWGQTPERDPGLTPIADVITVSELAAIRAELDALKATVERICKELGIS